MKRALLQIVMALLDRYIRRRQRELSRDEMDEIEAEVDASYSDIDRQEDRK